MSIVERFFKEGGASRVMPPADDDVSKACPLLWELLTVDRYRRGEDRILPELRVRRVSGGYEITLLDHESCQQLSALGGTWAALLAALEANLASGQPVWRVFKSYVNPKGLARHQKKGG